MKIKQNFHIHSQHSCDSACAKILDIMAEMKRIRNRRIWFDGSYSYSIQSADVVSARRDYLASRPPKNFHFGVE